MTPQISVLVAIDELGPFGKLLASLDRQTLAASEFEVIACAGEADAEQLRSRAAYRPNVRVVDATPGTTPGTWQTLVQAGSGDWLLPLAPTDEVRPDSLRRLLAMAEPGDDAVAAKGVSLGRRTADWSLLAADGTFAGSAVDPSSLDDLPLLLRRDLIKGASDTDLAGLRRRAVAAAGSVRTSTDYVYVRSAAATDPFETPAVAPYDVRWTDDGLELTSDDVPTLATVRSLNTGIEWALPSGRLVLDPATAALGRALGFGRWVVEVHGSDGPPRVVGTTSVPESALVDGMVVGLSTDDEGVLVVDVGSVRTNPFNGLTPTEASVSEGHRGTRLSLPLPVRHARGPHELDATLHLGGLPVPAEIVVRDGRVLLEAWLTGLPGKAPLALSINGSTVFPLPLVLVVENTGEMRLRRRGRKKAAAPEPEPSFIQSGVRRIARVAERLGVRRPE